MNAWIISWSQSCTHPHGMDDCILNTYLLVQIHVGKIYFTGNLLVRLNNTICLDLLFYKRACWKHIEISVVVRVLDYLTYLWKEQVSQNKTSLKLIMQPHLW